MPEVFCAGDYSSNDIFQSNAVALKCDICSSKAAAYDILNGKAIQCDIFALRKRKANVLYDSNLL